MVPVSACYFYFGILQVLITCNLKWSAGVLPNRFLRI